MTEHLSTQGRPDSRRELHCFWCPNDLNPPIDASCALKVVKNQIEWRKLWPLKVEGVKNFKKQTTKHYKGWFSNTKKILCMFFFLVAIRVQR
jgi:hypothetical protein